MKSRSLKGLAGRINGDYKLVVYLGEFLSKGKTTRALINYAFRKEDKKEFYSIIYEDEPIRGKSKPYCHLMYSLRILKRNIYHATRRD